MWHETSKKVDLELSLIHRLLDSQRDLLRKVRDREPDSVELLALSALLHSFYTGLETAFKRIALEIDGHMPSGIRSHSDLLMQMARPYGARSAVISDDLRCRLGEYMDFRHMFRHAYSFDLKWRKMSGLVLSCVETLDSVEAELSSCFRGLG